MASIWLPRLPVCVCVWRARCGSPDYSANPTPAVCLSVSVNSLTVFPVFHQTTTPTKRTAFDYRPRSPAIVALRERDHHVNVTKTPFRCALPATHLLPENHFENPFVAQRCPRACPPLCDTHCDTVQCVWSSAILCTAVYNW